jgi:cephalosporin hydroxylase
MVVGSRLPVATIPAMTTDPATIEASFDPVVRRFHDLYSQTGWRTWSTTTWMGVPLIKCPFDLWVYQEILFERRPDVIVETGTYLGGSAYFLASVCDMIGCGRVITIDLEEQAGRPEHPRITYLTGSSVSPGIVSAVHESVGSDERAMVILDSNHHHKYVLREMRAYGSLVGIGDYLVVEDTSIELWQSEWTSGPILGVQEFLSEDDRFEADRSREKFFMTWNPCGFLVRARPGPSALERRREAGSFPLGSAPGR